MRHLSSWSRSRRGACGLLALALILAPRLLPAQEVKPTEHPFLWKIEREPPSYLFGTIHLPDERVTALPPIVVEALESSDVVLTEIRMDKMPDPKVMYLANKQTLRDVLDDETFERVEAYFSSKGFPTAMLQRYKVWAVMMVLVQLETMEKIRAGAKALDQVIWSEGRDMGLDTDALETIEEQIGVFENFDTAEQVVMLNGTLDVLEKLAAEKRSYVEEIIDVYLQGDAEKLQEFMDSFTGIADKEVEKKFEKLLLADRNAVMVDRMIEKMSAQPEKSFFFAVGAAHYPNKTGILELLRKKGIETKRVVPEKAAKVLK